MDVVPVSQLCEEYQIQPPQFYQWQRQLSENGEDMGQKYMVMEYIDSIAFSESLNNVDLIHRIRLGVGIGCQILVALDFAHRKSVVHRDVIRYSLSRRAHSVYQEGLFETNLRRLIEKR